MTQRGRRAFARACAVAVSAVLISGCAGDPAASPEPTIAGPTSRSSPASSPTAAPSETVALTIVGDSNSTGYSGTLDAGIAARTAWVALLPAEEYTFVGGWAIDGSTTTDMADAATPVAGAELLVILGGTNDLAYGIPTDTTLQEVVRIAEAVQAPSVAVAAIPPSDFLPAEASALNSELAALAAERGWIFIDPWVGMRNEDGTWVSAFRTDGIHTSPDGYAAAASQIALQLEGAEG